MSGTRQSNGSSAWSPSAITDWLLDKGRFYPDPHSLLQGLGDALLEAGAPVWRLRLAMRTLHPLMTAIGSAWEREPGGSQRVQAPHGLELRPSYIGSPMEQVSKTGQNFRRRLTEALTGEDHQILHDLKRRGATDYLAIPLRFSEGQGAIFVVSTDTAGGLSDADVTAFSGVAAVLAPIAEVFRSKETAAAIAEAYLGSRTGRRVLAGKITRGDVERIHAAILVSDIRDWTGISSRLPAEDALALANRYFDLLAEAVEDQGGEILKFIGDGILAVFPAGENDKEAKSACRSAVHAATQALSRANRAEPPLGFSFGIGLHFGEVLYGNIGSRTRLDFTVLGSAVNIAARLEGLCRDQGRPLLFSEAVAHHLTGSIEPLGRVRLKGVEEEILLFGGSIDPEY